MTAPKKIGELLVEQGLINSTQLAAALQQQRTTQEFLGAILVRSGWVTEEALLKALAGQFRVPYVRLREFQVDWSAARHFSSPLLMSQKCFPLQIDEETMTVAISNPLDAMTISEVEKQARFREVHWVLMPLQDVLAALQEFQRQSRKAARFSQGGA